MTSPATQRVDAASSHEEQADALVSAAIAGDSDAQSELLRAVAPSVLKVVRMMLGANHPDVEDLLQDSLLGLLRAFPSYQGRSSVVHYARRIGILRCLEARRQGRATDRMRGTYRDLQATLNPSVRTPHKNARCDRQRQLLRELLHELPDNQLETFTLRYLLEHSIDEIAEMMDTPRNTVRSRLRLARETMRNRIGADSDFAELREGIDG